MTLLAYPNGETQKAAIVAELQTHADHDRLIKGKYWENGKGCAVGCTIKSGEHALYEPMFGIPQSLARLEDTIFENLPNKEAMCWPMRFMLAPKVGADLSLVQWKFLAFVVGEALSRPEAVSVREACQPALEIVNALGRGEIVSESAAESARNAAESAVESAVEIAAESAASAAESAAESARSAAESPARSAWSAAESARNAAWIRYADKLIELMEAA